MQLYTFILNFRGGTYISQFRGDDLVSVVRNWIEELDTTDIAHLGEDDLRLANENWDWDEDEITPINGVKNVWCHTFLIEDHEDHLALLNIIKTAS